MRVKICGISDVETGVAAVEAGATALGFVFAKSKRQVTPTEARRMIAALPDVVKVGVFVNETKENVEEIAATCQLDYVQLHGDEDAAYVAALSVPTIQAFGIASEDDVIRALQSPADYILFDSPKGVYHGGNGTSFSWAFLANLSQNDRKRMILAGGLNVENVKDAIAIAKPYMVDASSSVETNGKKDQKKIEAFIKECLK